MFSQVSPFPAKLLNDVGGERFASRPRVFIMRHVSAV